MPLYEVALFRGNTDRDLPEGLIEMVDTPAKQLQAIADLYLIIKAQPKYKALKEPNWHPDTEPIVVLNWMLRKLSPLAKGDPWTIDTWNDGKKLRYRFVVYRQYNSQILKHRPEFVPLDFLPALRKRDLPLHDLILDVVALVSRENKIPLWDEDGEFSEVMEELIAEHESSDIESIYLQSQGYTNIVADYLIDIKRRRKRVKAHQLEAQITEYDADSQRKRAMAYWLKKGVELARTKDCIDNHSFIPHYEPGDPVTPYRQYKFVWSLHSRDFVWSRVNDFLNNDGRRSGWYYPVQYSVAKPGEALKPVQRQDFPILLYQFLSYGHSCLLYTHRQYFYKHQYEAQQTPIEIHVEEVNVCRTQAEIQARLAAPTLLVDILAPIENPIQIRV